MGALLRFCREFKWHPLALDHALALFLLALNLLVPGGRHVGERIELNQTVVLLSVVGAVALTFRRRAPLVVLAVTTAVATVFAIAEQGKSPIILFMACAVYTVVVRKDRRTRSIAVGAVAVTVLTAEVLFVDANFLDNLGIAFLVLFAGALGEAVRYRRAFMAELEERALRAEQSRDEEAQRRVIEERLRIAHELHDVIAHHIALMNVQSGVAAHVLRSQPEEAERALALVRSGGRTVLQELTVLLGVLRRPGTSMPTAPAPSLQELGALIESFAAAGVEVDWETPDSIGRLPEVTELTAYRIVQESLTNVLKHAPGAAVRIRLARRPGSLAVDITDTGPTTYAPSPSVLLGSGQRDNGRTAVASSTMSARTPGALNPAGLTQPGAGHGLLGMRERVTAVGGKLATGPEPGGGFGVHAVLPLETGVVGDDPGAAGRRPDADPQRVPGAGELSPRSRGCG
ncbi:signal transduction histidine kinase [Kribbella sp. VKM Ac-2527]|uniref:histidine kinase n=1 Tax=Kribbella caucasensis TaxID=2512215 RepID=A0A4R6JKW7_9ACTN|nr:histidine kinase [Kribbella sp. VKM Ac-2527]TDO36352.1 signal transduction histidine kinase [Kribbella sp. VKM Ac-2527]